MRQITTDGGESVGPSLSPGPKPLYANYFRFLKKLEWKLQVLEVNLLFEFYIVLIKSKSKLNYNNYKFFMSNQKKYINIPMSLL